MSTEPPARVRLYAEIEEGLTRIARVAYSRRAARRMVERSGVDLPALTMTTLADIHRLQPVRLTNLAEEMGYEPSRVSKEVRRLLVSGLVEQERERRDRRAYQLRVTERGVDAHRRHRQAADELVADALGSWSDDDLETLLRASSGGSASAVGHDDIARRRTSRSRGSRRERGMRRTRWEQMQHMMPILATGSSERRADRAHDGASASPGRGRR